MRIVDLLSKNSIKLNASPKSKSEAIDMLIDLQEKAEISPIRKLIKKASSQERKRVRPLLAKELQYHTQKAKL